MRQTFYLCDVRALRWPNFGYHKSVWIDIRDELNVNTVAWHGKSIESYFLKRPEAYQPKQKENITNSQIKLGQIH